MANIVINIAHLYLIFKANQRANVRNILRQWCPLFVNKAMNVVMLNGVPKIIALCNALMIITWGLPPMFHPCRRNHGHLYQSDLGSKDTATA